MSIRIFFAVIIFNSLIFAMDDISAFKVHKNFRTTVRESWILTNALESDAGNFLKNDYIYFHEIANEQMWSNYYYFFLRYHEAKRIYAKSNRRKTSLLDRSHPKYSVIHELMTYLRASIQTERGFYPPSAVFTFNQICRALSQMDENSFFGLCDDLIVVSSFGLLLTRKDLLEQANFFKENTPFPAPANSLDLCEKDRGETSILAEKRAAKNGGELKIIDRGKSPQKKKRKIKNFLRMEGIRQSK